jgi:hypothetical protein
MTSIWGATDRAPVTGTMRIPVDTSSSSGPGYIEADDLAAYVSSGIPFAAASGTVDAITADFTPNVTVANGLIVAVSSTGTNTVTNPTFTPDGGTSRTITKNGGSALAIGDLPAAGGIMLLGYDSANTRYELLNPSGAGLKTLWVPAAAIRPSSSGGCAALALVATAANQPDVSSLDFDASTAEYAQFSVRFPKGWNRGTVTAAFHWSHASTTTNFGVRWGLQGVAVSDDDGLATAYGTAQEVTDTGGTTNDLYVSPATSAITVAGTPAVGDQVFFRAYRDPANGADTMAIDARLMGVTLFYNSLTPDDA